MSSPMPFPSSHRFPARALRLLPLALALSFTVVAAADAPPPPPAVPAARPASVVPRAPAAPTAEQARELEDARRELARAAKRLSDLHRRYGVAGPQSDRPMPPGPAWSPTEPDRPRIGAVLAGDEVRGVRIAAVTPDGPAARAGLRSGDRLLTVDDIALDAAPADTRLYDARYALQTLEPGKSVRLRYERDGKAATVNLTPERGVQVMVFGDDGRVFLPEEQPGAAWAQQGMPGPFVAGAQHQVFLPRAQAAVPAGVPGSAPGPAPIGPEGRPYLPFEPADMQRIEILRMTEGRPPLQTIDGDCLSGAPCMPLPLVDAFRWSGLNLATVDARLGRYFGTRDGVLVLGAGEDLDGLEPGDVIRKVDGRSVRTPREMMDSLRGREAGAEVIVDYLRDRKSASARVRIPEAQPPMLPPLPLAEPMRPLPMLPPEGATTALPPLPAAPAPPPNVD